MEVASLKKAFAKILKGYFVAAVEVDMQREGEKKGVYTK